ncbi:hypothetical protein [Neisseria perflava]|uniref:hypothetical protein n=1 Tax=Neisseria perflava TaxID=33053 RepID=UPI0020A0E664|nr:hypothetical protein [Neisseria perflava]MCP1660244.1 hypothetical protein [Neisseria perflava]
MTSAGFGVRRQRFLFQTAFTLFLLTAVLPDYSSLVSESRFFRICFTHGYLLGNKAIPRKWRTPVKIPEKAHDKKFSADIFNVKFCKPKSDGRKTKAV